MSNTQIKLKNPASSYAPRLAKFMDLVVRVRSLTPRDVHLWQVMDCPAFEDTETALETALYNEKLRRKNG